MTTLLTAEDLKKHFVLSRKSLWQRSPVVLKAVEGVSLAIARNSTLGLVGESGCGKSTTGRLVLGLMPVTSGRVVFEGEPVSAEQNAAWRRMRTRMQMVYQDPLAALDRRLPVGAQVGEPLAIHRSGFGPAERRDKVHQLFQAVGLRREHLDRFPHELSGGQRQRIVLARALILDPSLLVCDEPIAALDVSIQAQVVRLLRDLQERLGIGYLFISHDLKVVRQVSDEVAVMYLGRIVEQGPPESLFKAPAHPYTQALVSAIPTPRRRTRNRIILEGEPPNPIELPKGCAFHGRCPIAVTRCRETAPSLERSGDGRRVACHLVNGGAG